MVSYRMLIVTVPIIAFLAAENVDCHDSSPLVVRAGTSVTLDCHNLPSNTSADVTWFCYGCTDDSTISANQRPETPLLQHASGISSVFDKYGRISLVRHLKALKYDPVRVQDSGHYRCQVGDGVSGHTIRLIVEDVPGAPGRPLVTRLGSHSVQLSWAPSLHVHNSAITHYIVHTREGSDTADDIDAQSWTERESMVTDSNSTRTLVSRLTPFTLYTFQVAAVNRVGASRPGPVSLPTVTLAQAPQAAPPIREASGAGPTSIRIVWSRLRRRELQGPFEAYLLAYGGVGAEDSRRHTVRIASEHVQEYTLEKLAVFCNYSIALAVQNTAGVGPFNNITVATSAGVPYAPDDVTVTDVTSHSVSLLWQPPKRINGRLSGYRVFYDNGNITEAATLRDTSSVITYSLENLQSSTTYMIKVNAFTETAEGDTTTPISVTTDSSIQPSPIIDSLHCQANNSVGVSWSHQDEETDRNSATLRGTWSHRSITEDPDGTSQAAGAVGSDNSNQSVRYYLVYRELSSNLWHSKLISDSQADTRQVYLRKVSQSALYEMYMLAATRSQLNSSLWREAAPSPTLRMLTPYPYCSVTEPVTDGSQSANESLSSAPPTQHVTPQRQLTLSGVTSLFSLSLAATASCLTLIIGLSVWRWFRCRSVSQRTIPQSPLTTHPLVISLADEPADWEMQCPSSGPALHELKGELLLTHLNQLLQHSAIELAMQFEELQSLSDRLTHSCSFSRRCDKEPTRGRHTLASDSLVPVTAAGQPGAAGDSHYINASYVDGFRAKRQYIVTRTPEECQLTTFWLMVWQQHVHTIVQLSADDNTDKYWSGEAERSCGPAQVELVDESVLATHTVRQLLLRVTPTSVATQTAASGGASARQAADNSTCFVQHRYIRHLQFRGWSSGAVGDDAVALLKFVRIVSGFSREHPDSSILVHCCCGVGEAGSFMVLDALLRQLAATGTVNVFGCVRQGRSQRRGLVRSPDHYRLVHAALRHWLSVGATELSRDELFDIEGATLALRDQFELATSYRPCQEDLCMCQTAVAGGMSRRQWPLAVESWRVVVSGGEMTGAEEGMEDGMDGFINASYMPGYRSQREFIVTEHPLVETVSAFWRMVWQEGSCTIVVMSSVNEHFPVFWPTTCSGPVSCGTLTISCLSHSCSAGQLPTQQLSLAVTMATNQQALPVALWLIPPTSHTAATAACHLADKLSTSSRSDNNNTAAAPIIVVDSYGGANAAKLACILAAREQFRIEGATDLFFLAKLYHEHRPGVWRHLEDYVDLFLILRQVLQTSPAATAAPSTGVLNHLPASYRNVVINFAD